MRPHTAPSPFNSSLFLQQNRISLVAQQPNLSFTAVVYLNDALCTDPPTIWKVLRNLTNFFLLSAPLNDGERLLAPVRSDPSSVVDAILWRTSATWTCSNSLKFPTITTRLTRQTWGKFPKKKLSLLRFENAEIITRKIKVGAYQSRRSRSVRFVSIGNDHLKKS